MEIDLSLQEKMRKIKKSESSDELCSHVGNEDNKMYPHSGDDTG